MPDQAPRMTIMEPCPANPPAGLPTRKQILDFIAQSGQPAGQARDRAGVQPVGHDKIVLKALLKDMADEGLIDCAPGRAFHKAGGVPKVTVLRVVVGRRRAGAGRMPENGTPTRRAPKLRVIERGRRSALALNDRILARTEERGAGPCRARR